MSEKLKLSPSSNLQDTILQERMERGYCNILQSLLTSKNSEDTRLFLHEDWLYLRNFHPFFIKKRGGTLLLMYAEQNAIQFNREIIRLKPHALVQEPRNMPPKNWYKKWLSTVHG